MIYNDYLILVTLDCYKKLSKNANSLYYILTKLNSCFGNKEYFFLNSKEISKLLNKSLRTFSRAKKELIYWGLIKIQKRYDRNGNRRYDNYHICSISEILFTLKKDNLQNEKDINRIKNLIGI